MYHALISTNPHADDSVFEHGLYLLGVATYYRHIGAFDTANEAWDAIEEYRSGEADHLEDYER